VLCVSLSSIGCTPSSSRQQPVLARLAVQRSGPPAGPARPFGPSPSPAHRSACSRAHGR
jgi:hypothetical protein